MTLESEGPPTVRPTPGRARLQQTTTVDTSQFTPFAGRCQAPIQDLIHQAETRLDREERAAEAAEALDPAEAALVFDRHTVLAGRHRAILRELRQISGEGRRG